jgi:hypothetical protein
LHARHFRKHAVECTGRSSAPSSVALFTFYYNFVRIHQTLRVTPAMAAGVSDRLWEMGDVVKLLEDCETKRIEHKKVTAITSGAWKD